MYREWSGQKRCRAILLNRESSPRFPGASEWLLAFATMALAATEFQLRTTQGRVHSSLTYYFQEPGIAPIHFAATVLDVLIFAVPVVWILSSRGTACKAVMMVLCSVGVALCWIEAVRASGLQGGVYSLQSLPYAPLNNFGLIGAQVFGTYLVFKLPWPDRRWLPGILVRSTISLCLWLSQVAVWSVVAKS